MAAEVFTVDTSELERMAAAYQGGPAIVADETSKAIRAGLFAIEAGAKVYVPVDLGYLKSTIAAGEPIVFGGVLMGEVRASAEYAATAEYGFPAQQPGNTGRLAHPYLIRSFNEVTTGFLPQRILQAQRTAFKRIATQAEAGS